MYVRCHFHLHATAAPPYWHHPQNALHNPVLYHACTFSSPGGSSRDTQQVRYTRSPPGASDKAGTVRACDEHNRSADSYACRSLRPSFHLQEGYQWGVQIHSQRLHCERAMTSSRGSMTANHVQNHNPAAQNGSDSAWNILSPIWSSQSITPLRTAFKSPQSWLNYRTGSFGEVVDRFRWEGGCIAEHVSLTSYTGIESSLTWQSAVGSRREISSAICLNLNRQSIDAYDHIW